MTSSTSGGTRPRTPVHLWIVGGLSLLWNAMGAFDYVATQLKLDFYMSQFTPEQLEYFYGFPAWAVAGWAFGVWGAVVGSILLLLRTRWALWALVVSIVGMVVSSLYTLVLSNGMEIMDGGGMVFTIVIWVVAILLVVYAWRQTKNGVLV
jgi:hypothetical protein